MNFIKAVFSAYKDSSRALEAYRRYEYRNESIEYVKSIMVERPNK